MLARQVETDEQTTPTRQRNRALRLEDEPLSLLDAAFFPVRAVWLMFWYLKLLSWMDRRRYKPRR